MFELTDYQKAVFHESGHAVTYHILGRELKKVYAKENGDGFCIPKSSRGVHFSYGLSELLKNEITELAFICFAGYVAESELFLKSFKPIDAYKMGAPKSGVYPENDFGNLRNKMMFSNNLAGQEYFDFSFFSEMHGLTVELIKSQAVRNAIGKVAEAIFNSPNSKLTDKEVHTLCEEFITMDEGTSRFINQALSA